MTRAESDSNHHETHWRWADVFARHHAAFFAYALHYEPGIHDAEDLVQSALLRLAERRARPDQDAAAYALAAIRNLALDRRRRRTVRQAGHSTAENPWPAVVGCEAADAAEGALDGEDRARLQAAFDSLDEARREVVILKVFGELSLRQIATVLDQPLGTVASIYRRALIDIREKLERECQSREATHAQRSR